VVRVPGAATTGNVVVAVGGVQSNGVAFTVVSQTPTVVVSPASIAPGGTLTVTWQNIATPTEKDWFALVPVGAPDNSLVARIYGTSGVAADSTAFPTPSSITAGSYEVRLFSNDTVTRLAVSNTITVTAPGPSLDGTPVKPAPGQTLTVQWRNIPAPTAADWVGLYQVGAGDSNYVVRATTNGRDTDHLQMNLPGTLPSGPYELRLFSNNTFTKLAISNGLDIEAGAGVSVSPIDVAGGGTLNVTWNGIATPSPTDWYALVPQNGLDASQIASSYTTGAASGNGTLPLPANAPGGNYELRLHSQSTGQRVAVSNLVKIGTTLVVSPTTVAPGGTVTITWSGIPAPTGSDWISLNAVNSADAYYISYTYGNPQATAAGSITFTLPASLLPGLYDMRLFSNNSMNRLALSNVITVTAPGPTLAVTPVTISNGATLTATWNGIASPSVNNWIGIYAAGAPDANFLSQTFTSGVAAGTTSMVLSGLPAGTYELRLFADSAFTRLAVSNSFTVIPGATLQASPSTIAAGGTLTVTWQGIATPMAGDWIALAPLGSADSVYASYQYTGGTASGSQTLNVPLNASGSYEVRLFSNNTYQKLGVSNVVTVP